VLGDTACRHNAVVRGYTHGETAKALEARRVGVFVVAN
jgi:hypothetical protein